MRANQRRKYEKKHAPSYRRAINCDLRAAVPCFVCSTKRGTMAKAQTIAQQLDLTPQQKEKILPILAAEVPKVQAIKNDNSLNKIQKIQQLRAIHQQTDPQMKAILSPQQYQKLQAIRQQTIRDATQIRVQ
jgi:Spy/CpxP family protein refolding chaperone